MKPITYRGKSQSLPAWSRELGIPEGTLRSRLNLLGMSIEDAFSRPPDSRFCPEHLPRKVAPKPPPKLKRHDDGRAYVRWMENRTKYRRYFGVFDSPEATAAYHRFCAEWIAGRGHPTPQPSESFSVATVADRFLSWADGYYQKNGRPTSEIHSYRSAIATLNRLYGSTGASDFGPNQLRAVQAEIERSGVKLRTVNGYVTRITRVFSWAAGRGMVPAAVADALKHVESLAPGRSTAKVSVAKMSVEVNQVEAIFPHLHPDPERRAVLTSMVQLQSLTGMRPGEVCELRLADVDRARTPWLYRPASGGKTFHLEKDRKVWLGPEARKLLAPLLDGIEPDVAVFGFRRRRGEDRVGVSVKFYRERIKAACKAAGIPPWTPHRLRHSKATSIQRRYEDDEAVAAVLGNTPEVARQVYVDDPRDAVAKRIAEELG